MIQPHFDYACLTWYPNLNKSLKKKLQTTQNKCIRFCLLLGNREHVGFEEFERINWLNINDRFEQCLSVFVYKFFNKSCRDHMSDIFLPVKNRMVSTRNSFFKLDQPFRKTTQGIPFHIYVLQYGINYQRTLKDVKISILLNMTLRNTISMK